MEWASKIETSYKLNWEYIDFTIIIHGYIVIMCLGRRERWWGRLWHYVPHSPLKEDNRESWGGHRIHRYGSWTSSKYLLAKFSIEMSCYHSFTYFLFIINWLITGNYCWLVGILNYYKLIVQIFKMYYYSSRMNGVQDKSKTYK